MKNIYLQMLRLQSPDTPLVLATVVRTIGSTPQKPGSSALFNEKGLVTGTVGGGIVEGKVQKLAAEAILSKNSGLFHFNLANDISRTEEAICGGEISVLTDATPLLHRNVFDQLQISLENDIPGVLITMVTSGLKKGMTIKRYWISEMVRPSLPADFLAILDPEVTKLINEKNPSGFSRLRLMIRVQIHRVWFFFSLSSLLISFS